MTMLDRMRRHKAWLKWFLGLVAVAMCLYLIPDFLTGNTSTAGSTAQDVLAEVGDRKITSRDFDSRYQAQLDSYRQQFGSSVNESLLKQLGVEQQVLRQLIEEQVAAIEADRQGVRVSNDELVAQILALPVFQEGGQFVGDQRYRQILQSMNPPLTVGQFEEELRRGLVLDHLRTSLTGWVAVSDAELEREYKARNEKVKMQLVALTAASFTPKVSASDADVAAHYESHKDSYKIGEQRRIRYFVIDPAAARLEVQVTPTEIQRDYNDNLDRYRTPEQVRASHILLKTEGKSEAEVRTRAEGILKQVQGGADFAALAKRVSEDEGSKAAGGDLSYFSRGRNVPEFDKVAFDDLQPGQTSGLVKSQFGFHIIRVTDRKPEVTRPLAEVSAEIQERLRTQKANRLIAEQASRIASDIKSAPDLDKGAAAAGAKVETSDFFPRQSAIPGIGAAPPVNDAAFRLKDTTELAGPIDTPRGPVFLSLAGTKAPYVPALDEVKVRVRNDLIKIRAVEVSRQRAAEIAATLRSARDFTAAAKGLGLEAKETTLIPRGSPLPDVGASKEVDAIAFDLPAGSVSAPISTNDATVIVKVTERDEATPEELQKDRETFRAEILNERREQFFSAYMSRAKDRTRIQVHNDAVRRVLNDRGL